MWKEPDTKRSLRCPQGCQRRDSGESSRPDSMCFWPRLQFVSFLPWGPNGFLCMCLLFLQTKEIVWSREIVQISTMLWWVRQRKCTKDVLLPYWSAATRGRWLIYCAAVHVRRLAPVFFLAHCCFLRRETATDLHFKRWLDSYRFPVSVVYIFIPIYIDEYGDRTYL